MRTDYRNQYKGWDKPRIEKHLDYLKEKLLMTIGVCDSNANNYLKQISYLENKTKQS